MPASFSSISCMRRKPGWAGWCVLHRRCELRPPESVWPCALALPDQQIVPPASSQFIEGGGGDSVHRVESGSTPIRGIF